MNRVGSSQQQAPETGWLIKSVERMFRPVIRVLVGRVSCNVVVDLVKQIFVQEARNKLHANDPGRRVTKSALALVTGLDTRAITAIEDSKQEYSIIDLSPEAAVLGVWATDDLFKDSSSGEPLVLPIYGRGLSFQTLVTRTIGRNVTCPTVLDKLTESGNVEVVNENFVRLKERFYRPVKESERVFFEAGSFALNRLGSTIVHNMNSTTETGERWVQQDRWTQKLPPERLKAFREEAKNLLERHIREAEVDLEPFEAPVRNEMHYSAGVGWYYWEEPPPEHDESEK